MIRFLLLTTLVVAGCLPNTAEIRCGKTLCGSNQRCEPKNLICVLDEAPQLLIDEPRVGSLIAGDTLTISGSVRDDNGAATLELSLDEGKSWVQVPMSSERFSGRVALPSMDYQPLGLTLRAHDSLQQASTQRVGITVDNLAPALTVGSPIDNATLNLAWFSAGPKVRGLAADGSGLAALTVDVGEGEVAVTAIGDQFSYDWALPQGADGITRTVRVSAVDLAGNRTTATREVKIDVVPPQLTFTVPAVDALLGSAFFLGGGLVQGRVSAGAKVTADFGKGPQLATVADGQWSALYAPAPGLDFQPQLLEVTAADEAGNVARAVRMTTVDVVAPVLTFTAPAQGARLNAASFPSGDDVAVAFTVTDGDPQVAVRNANATVAGSGLKVPTSPTDNPKAYALTLSAQDRAGNSSQAPLSFEVDRLRPSVTARTPAGELRNAAPSVAIDFSEDVMGAAGVTLTPAGTAGTWTTPRHFELSGLPADSVFTATVGAVTDAFGNPCLAPPAVRFHTAPALPASGATLMTGVWRFKAAADADGVLTLFTTSPTTPATFRWARVNPKTALVEDNRPAWLPVLGGDFTEVAAYGESQVKPDLSAQRVSAATTLRPSMFIERRAWVREADAAATSSLGMVGVVPVRALPGEGPGLAEIGFLKQSAGGVSYTRGGMTADLGIGMGAPTAMGFAANRWELIEARNQVLKRRSFESSKPFANAPPVCAFSPVEQWTDLAATDATSYAISDACSVFIYDSDIGKRRMRIHPKVTGCLGQSCPGPTHTDLDLWTELRVASDRKESNSFVAATRVVGGVQLMRLALDASCQGGFVDAGAVVAVPPNAAFEPVSLGGKPALLYVDAANLLKVYLP